MVAMGLPVPLAKVNFHVALHESLALHHQQGIAEIGAGGDTGSAGIQDPDACARFSMKSAVTRGAALPQEGQLLFRDGRDRVSGV